MLLKITVTFQTGNKKGAGRKQTQSIFLCWLQRQNKNVFAMLAEHETGKGRMGKIRAYICVLLFGGLFVYRDLFSTLKNVSSWDEGVQEVRNGMYQSATLVPKQENISRKYFTNKKSRMSSECTKKIFFFLFPSSSRRHQCILRAESNNSFFSLVHSRSLSFFKYNSAHLLATTLGSKGIWLLILL